MALVLDKDELFRYLKGEISIQDWKQGQELLELFAGDDAKGQTFRISVGDDAALQPSTSSIDVGVMQPAEGDEGEMDEDGEEEEEEDDDDEDYQVESTSTKKKKRVHFDKGAGPSSLADDDDDYDDDDDDDDNPFRPPKHEKETWWKTWSKACRNLVPKPLRGLMGEAHLCFARGAHEEAIAMCSEIIKQAPKCPDPFQLLGMIYEDKGEMEKSLQFSLIAAHLNPSDVEEWVKLAETCLEQDNVKQALHCYTKALKYDPKNVSLLWEKANLYDQLKDHKKAMECYHTVLKVLPPEKAQESLQLARDMVKTCHQSGDILTAVDILETTISKHPDMISSEDVNMLAELHMSNRQFVRALQVISDHCSITMRSASCPSYSMQQLSLDESSPRPDVDDVEVVMPDGIPIDLRVKLGVCLVHCKHFRSAKVVLTLLFDESPDEMGDLYLDVAEAYVEGGQYSEAKPILASLVKTSNYNLPAVWLRYADCLNNLGSLKDASDAYRKVLEQVPSHLDARLTLATVVKQLGNVDEALRVLSMEEESDSEILGPHDINLLYQRCLLQHSHGYHMDFTKTAWVMMTQYLRMVKPSEDDPQAMYATTFTWLSHGLHEDGMGHDDTRCIHLLYQRCMLQRSHGYHMDFTKTAWVMMTQYLRMVKPSEDDPQAVVMSGNFSALNKDDWFNLFCKTCEALVATKQFDKAAQLCIRAMRANIKHPDRQPLTTEPVKKEKMEFVAICCCFFSGQYTEAFNFIKGLLTRSDGNCAPGWNFFNLITNYTLDTRHHRFCLRLTVRKFPESFALSVLNGHNAFVAGSFKHALGEYVRGYKMEPGNPLLNFCIGLCMLHIACQRFSLKKHSLIVQGFSFLKRYEDLRGDSQEVSYNLGRALHQLGLYHLAVHFYQKALDTPPSIAGDARFDLQREVAYNLSLIYQHSGNEEMAAQLIYQHIVI
ncbi:LOW QUALITY PROTEIN: general transcription factor 3C polypeptide 3-like [Amphiura filiformis]|uniref:LOW QUALITY PROTEIN: general transcription factor 3C polypeptide 3-like n=1 Tax=Amphiura filiformis TaxID=82378 RepID=UPI003B222588